MNDNLYTHPTHRIVISSIYCLGYRLDRPLFERAAFEAIEANPDLLLWRGERWAIDEIMAHKIKPTEADRLKYENMQLTNLAAELVAHRLVKTVPVWELIRSEEVDIEADQFTFAVRLDHDQPFREIER